MRRIRFAVAVCAFLASGCGSGPEPDKPKPENGGGGDAKPVDLEAECRAASEKWKTFRAEYKGDDATSPTIVVALDREGRAAIRFSDGHAFVLESGWLRMVLDSGRITRIPIGEIIHAMRALERREPMPARGTPLEVPAGCCAVEFRLSVDAAGRRERSISLGFATTSRPPFGWLHFLAPADGVTIRAVDRTAVVSGPMGRLVIDRDSGGLCDWAIEGAGRSRVTATALEIDKPLDPVIFRLEGVPADVEAERQMTVLMILRVGGEAAPKRRDEEFAGDLARACFRIAWREADIESLAETGARRRREAAKEMRASHPDISAEDLDAVSKAACRNAIEEALGPGASAVDALLREAFQPDKEGLKRLRRDLEAAATVEVFGPAVERANAKK